LIETIGWNPTGELSDIELESETVEGEYTNWDYEDVLSTLNPEED
jgi:hypothetical protein